jgi:hypothetical protein
VEAEFVVPSLSWDLLGFISIDDSPSLVPSIMSSPDDNWLSFSIFVSSNIENLLVLNVNEVFTRVLESLPPS